MRFCGGDSPVNCRTWLKGPANMLSRQASILEALNHLFVNQAAMVE